MQCDELKLKLEAYHDRELPDEVRAACKSHLAACPHCAQLVADRQAFSDQVRSALDLEPPADLRERLRSVLSAVAHDGAADSPDVISLAEAAEHRGTGWRWILSRPVGLAAAATVTLALVAWWLGIRPDPVRPSEPFSRPANVLILRFAPADEQAEVPVTGGLILANHL
jgi:anti-sigma factor RsiW